MNPLKKIFYAVIFLAAMSEIAAVYIFHPGHGPLWFENLPAFGSLYGFVSCVVIIAVSKFLGRRFLMKREDYYD